MVQGGGKEGERGRDAHKGSEGRGRGAGRCLLELRRQEREGWEQHKKGVPYPLLHMARGGESMPLGKGWHFLPIKVRAWLQYNAHRLVPLPPSLSACFWTGRKGMGCILELYSTL